MIRCKPQAVLGLVSLGTAHEDEHCINNTHTGLESLFMRCPIFQMFPYHVNVFMCFLHMCSCRLGLLSDCYNCHILGDDSPVLQKSTQAIEAVNKTCLFEALKPCLEMFICESKRHPRRAAQAPQAFNAYPKHFMTVGYIYMLPDADLGGGGEYQRKTKYEFHMCHINFISLTGEPWDIMKDVLCIWLEPKA